MHTTAKTRTSNHRARWAALGAAVAVSVGAGGLSFAHAAVDSGERAIFQPISPCRLADTRSGADNVGTRSKPVGASETWKLSVAGPAGDCPAFPGASALELNVTALNASQATFLTLHPADVALPKASNLNPVPGQAPTPNSVTVTLSDAGEFAVYNAFGQLDVVIDVVGYYADHNHDDRYYTEQEVDQLLAGVGTQPGPAGPAGKAGKDGRSAWDVIPSGVTVTGVAGFDASTTGSEGTDRVVVNLPGVAPQDLHFDSVNFAPHPHALDDDAECTGSTTNPTAPAGKLCIYLDSRYNASQFSGTVAGLADRGFMIQFTPTTTEVGMDYRFNASWAYTAP